MQNMMQGMAQQNPAQAPPGFCGVPGTELQAMAQASWGQAGDMCNPQSMCQGGGMAGMRQPGQMPEQPSISLSAQAELELELSLRGSLLVQQQRRIVQLEDELQRAWAEIDRLRTKIAAVDLAATEAQGFPSRYALLDPMAESDDDIDSDFGDDGPDTLAAARDGLTTPTTGSSNLKDLPGTIKMLAGVKSVTQLAAADSDPMLKKLDWWVRAMATATGVPFFEFDMGGDQPSGESRRRASTRIINRAKKAQRALGASHLRLIDTLLGAYGVEDADVKVAWLPAEVANDAEGMELVKAKTRNGVPLKDALVEAGYLPETVDEWLASTPYSLSEVETIAASLGELAKAETLGAILPEETRALLPAVLTGARGEGVPPPADPEA
jgi:hypothetical protein